MNMELEAAQALLDTSGYGAVRVAIGRVLHWRYRLFQKRKHEGAVLERIAGVPLVVLPGVLNPRLMRTGKFFAAELNSIVIAPDAEVLDMGTGSGVCAIFAARYARRVVAIDINPAAVDCALANVLVNRMADRIDVVQGDLFAPLQGRRFDVVLFNPPFMRGAPRSDADRAWRSTDVAERFAASLGDHLKPGGSALVLLSSFGDATVFLEEFRKHGFAVSVLAERRFVNEKLAIFRLKPPILPTQR